MGLIQCVKPLCPLRSLSWGNIVMGLKYEQESCTLTQYCLSCAVKYLLLFAGFCFHCTHPMTATCWRSYLVIGAAGVAVGNIPKGSGKKAQMCYPVFYPPHLSPRHQISKASLLKSFPTFVIFFLFLYYRN